MKLAERNNNDNHLENPQINVGFALITVANIAVIILILGACAACRVKKRNNSTDRDAVPSKTFIHYKDEVSTTSVLSNSFSKSVPQKPVRKTSSKAYENVFPGVFRGQFVTTSVSSTKENGSDENVNTDDIELNLPFIDGSREGLDNMENETRKNNTSGHKYETKVNLIVDSKGKVEEIASRGHQISTSTNTTSVGSDHHQAEICPVDDSFRETNDEVFCSRQNT